MISGVADFGISFQEQVTLARVDDIAIVSIAAMIQHNTSGFASRGELNVNSPKDWEGIRYGSFGSPFEEPTLEVLMECDSGDFSTLEVVNTGFADPLALLDEAQTDLAWIFFAWQGIQAEIEGIDLNVIMTNDKDIIEVQGTAEQKPFVKQRHATGHTGSGRVTPVRRNIYSAGDVGMDGREQPLRRIGEPVEALGEQVGVSVPDGRERVEERFSLARMVDETLEVYRMVLAC